MVDNFLDKLIQNCYHLSQYKVVIMQHSQFDQQSPADKDCLIYLEQIRWGDTQKCTYCGSTRRTLMIQERRYHCNTCNTSFSVTVGTPFHQTHLSLQKWFQAIALLLNPRGCISVRQLARHLNVNKDTAWRMVLKIREALAEREQRELLFRIVEISEVFSDGETGRWKTTGVNLKTHERKKRMG